MRRSPRWIRQRSRNLGMYGCSRHCSVMGPCGTRLGGAPSSCWHNVRRATQLGYDARHVRRKHCHHPEPQRSGSGLDAIPAPRIRCSGASAARITCPDVGGGDARSGPQTLLNVLGCRGTMWSPAASWAWTKTWRVWRPSLRCSLRRLPHRSQTADQARDPRHPMLATVRLPRQWEILRSTEHSTPSTTTWLPLIQEGFGGLGGSGSSL
jgi:hypothetical protein